VESLGKPLLGPTRQPFRQPAAIALQPAADGGKFLFGTPAPADFHFQQLFEILAAPLQTGGAWQATTNTRRFATRHNPRPFSSFPKQISNKLFFLWRAYKLLSESGGAFARGIMC
jgi:hypothetical protein